LDGVSLATNEGTPVVASVLTAYNYFGEPGMNKRWVLARPIFQSGSVPASNIGILVDFVYTGSPDQVTLSGGALAVAQQAAPPQIGLQASSTGSQWNSAIWNGSAWPDSTSRYRNWVSISGIGYCAALSIDVSQSSELLWTATDFVFEMGSVI
jgi:hypothetical protein